MSDQPLSSAAKAPASAYQRHELTLEYEPNTGCWLSSASGPGGYAQVRFKGRRILGHRASWEHHRGPIPRGLYVLHRCDTPACCNPDHLFVGSARDNTVDMIRKGRGKFPTAASGEKNVASKLTPEKVREIRLTYRRGVPGCGQVALSHRFNVNHKTIRRVIEGETWSHVQ